MSEYDPNNLAQQDLYGTGRDPYANVQPRGMRMGGYVGGGSGGSGRHRGRRSGGGNGHWNGYGQRGGSHHRYGGDTRGGGDRQDPEEWHLRRLREVLFRMGEGEISAIDDFHPPSELLRVSNEIEENASRGPRYVDGLCDIFRTMTTEQPHKLPLVAALIGFLVISPQQNSSKPSQEQEQETTDENGAVMDTSLPDVKSHQTSSSIGLLLIKDLIAMFRSDLDARLWRNIRLSLQLFASLAALGVIRASSVRSVLSSFAAVLSEPGVTAARGDRAAMCIIETMCRTGRDLLRSNDTDGEDVNASRELDELVEKVERYCNDYRNVEVDLVRPFAPSGDPEDLLHEDTFESAVEALVRLRTRSFRRPAFLPSSLDLLPPPIVVQASGPLPTDKILSLPDILVPPDDDELSGGLFAPSGSSGQSGKNGRREKKEARRAGLGNSEEEAWRAGAGIERVPRYGRWFRETVPARGTPSNVILRSTLGDIIDLYEVNRKECARILFDSARWLRKGTFTGKSISPEKGIFGMPEESWHVTEDGEMEGQWNLDELIVECILSTSLVLPQPPRKSLYYTSLLRETVTMSPQTVAPAMGKSVRRIYNAMHTGRPEGEIVHRFADWFSIHLSNFNFSWGWKEWIPDMTLPSAHPKVAFARRIVELEIRLAYFERVKGTLPTEIQERVMNSEEPNPAFTYAHEGHPFRDRAMALIQSFRARATAEVILAEMESFKREISPSSSFLPTDNDDSKIKVQNENEADIVIRDIVIQAILNIGSRSFSHFLNVVERYHALLRQLSSSPALRLAILSSTTRFWARSTQWIFIVFDKLLQYRIVEPADVVSFVFAPPRRLPSLVLEGSGDQVFCSASKTDAAENGSLVRDWSSMSWWEIVRVTVEKVNGRVDQVRRRVERLEREEAEEAERHEAMKAAGTEEPAPSSNMSEDGLTTSLFPGGATSALASEQLSAEASKKKKEGTSQEAKSALEAIQVEQRKVLVNATTGFVKLLQTETGQKVVQPHVELDETTPEEVWQGWWVLGWYREFLRLFNKNLWANHETIVASSFDGIAEGQPVRDIFERACQMASE